MLWLPRWVVHERLKSLHKGEEPVKAFALRGIPNALHDGGAEVRLREEGVAYQVLVFLWGEEQVLSNDMGVLRTKVLGGV